jgi:hypothetical protein
MNSLDPRSRIRALTQAHVNCGSATTGATTQLHEVPAWILSQMKLRTRLLDLEREEPYVEL